MLTRIDSFMKELAQQRSPVILRTLKMSEQDAKTLYDECQMQSAALGRAGFNFADVALGRCTMTIYGVKVKIVGQRG